MARWQFFTNHMHVLSFIAREPDARLREIARAVGITERATHRIISELEEEGYLSRRRVGSRNRYEIDSEAGLRHPLHDELKSEQVIRLLTGGEENAPAPARASNPEAQLYGQVFLITPAALAVSDPQGRILAANLAFCILLGRSEPELLGREFAEFTHPDDLEGDAKEFTELVRGTRTEAVRDKRYVRPDGTLVWVRLHLTATVDPSTGAPVHLGHAVDIGDSKRHELGLAEAEERFRSAFDNAPIGMALVAADGRFLKVNRALCELTGYAETALLMRSFQDITHADDVDAGLAYAEDMLAGRRRTYQTEERYHHADGRLIWVLLSVSLIRDAYQRPLYFIAQIQDITERKHREHALREHAAHLAALASAGPA